MSDSPQDSPRPGHVAAPQNEALTPVAVSAVLDVGVLSSTEFVISCFPTVPHVLFEPVDSYFEVIRTRYANLQYQLVHVALSDQDGTAWQIGISKDGCGRVTHSSVSDVAVTAGEQPGIVECKPVRKARLDTVMKEIDQHGPYLLKIDVDGHEIPVLNGATETFRNVSILIVEASVGTIRSKLDLAASPASSCSTSSTRATTMASSRRWISSSSNPSGSRDAPTWRPGSRRPLHGAHGIDSSRRRAATTVWLCRPVFFPASPR
jgi:FkbM family methyltransferase